MAAGADLQAGAARHPEDDQHHSSVQAKGGEAHGTNQEDDVVHAFFSLYFSFALADVSPKYLLHREAGKRVAAGAFICSAKASTRASKHTNGKLSNHNPADDTISRELKRLAAENRLPEMALHAILQLGRALIFGIYDELSAETICKQPWMCGLGDRLTGRMKPLCEKKSKRTKDGVETHGVASSALKSFSFLKGKNHSSLTMKEWDGEPK